MVHVGKTSHIIALRIGVENHNSPVNTYRQNKRRNWGKSFFFWNIVFVFQGVGLEPPTCFKRG